MGKSEKNNSSKIVIYSILIISLLLVAFSMYLIFDRKKPLGVEEFEVRFIVAEGNVGFDGNSSALIYGRTSPGGPKITRFVNITNDYEFPIRVDVFLSRNIAEAMETESSYDISVGEQKRIPIKLAVPIDFEVGEYVGKVRFEIYREG